MNRQTLSLKAGAPPSYPIPPAPCSQVNEPDALIHQIKQQIKDTERQIQQAKAAQVAQLLEAFQLYRTGGRE